MLVPEKLWMELKEMNYSIHHKSPIVIVNRGASEIGTCCAKFIHIVIEQLNVLQETDYFIKSSYRNSR